MRLLMTLILISPVICFAQLQPQIACPDYFRFERNGNNWLGVITPPVTRANNVSVGVRFSVNQVDGVGDISNVHPYPNKQVALDNIATQQPVHFYVVFGDFAMLPKVTEVSINGEIICQASQYGPPVTNMYRGQWIYSSDRRASEPAYVPVPAYTPAPTYAPRTRPPTTTRTTTTTTTTTTQPPPINRATPRANAPQNTQLQCGREGLTPFMIGGVDIPRGRFPWLSAIFHNTHGQWKYGCSGSLVTSNKVITAAHCVYGISLELIRLHLGRHNLDVTRERGAHMREVESVITHPDYEGDILPDCDVSIVKLAAPVEYSRYIRPICIWSSSDSTGRGGVLQATIAGWGKDHTGNSTPQPKMVNVETVPQTTCLHDMPAAKDFLSERTLCAGTRNGAGPCLGDSGGGLMVQASGRWILRGIISLGQRIGEKCDLSQYVIYCDLSKHTGWIQRNIN